MERSGSEAKGVTAIATIGVLLSGLFVVASTRGINAPIIVGGAFASIAFMAWVAHLRKSLKLLVLGGVLVLFSFLINNEARMAVILSGLEGIDVLKSSYPSWLLRSSFATLSSIPWFTFAALIPMFRKNGRSKTRR